MKAHRASLVVTAFLAVMVSVPGSAAAQETPSDSAFDQYLESIPGPRGEEPVGREGRRAPLSPEARCELEELGPTGESAGALAEIIGQPPGTRPERDRDRSGGGPAGVIESILDPVPGGFGILLPLILIVIALLALANYLARRRAGLPETGT